MKRTVCTQSVGGKGEILTMPKKEGFPGWEALVVDGMVGQELVACFACG